MAFVPVLGNPFGGSQTSSPQGGRWEPVQHDPFAGPGDNTIIPYKSGQLPDGMSEGPNVELWNRPTLQNPDGTVSTTSSYSDELEPGTEVVYPSVVDGKRLTREQAIEHYALTGQNLGKFPDPNPNTRQFQANQYAEQLHRQQDFYGRRNQGKFVPVDHDPFAVSSPSGPKNSYLGNMALGAAQKGAQSIIGGSLRLAVGAGDAVEDWVDANLRPYAPDVADFLHGTPAQREKNRAERQKIASSIENINLGYQEGTSWEDVKKNWVGNLIPFAVEQGLTSIPDMIAVMRSLPGYALARTGVLGQTRAQNDERQNATIGDFVKAAPAAVASALLERLGTEKLLGVDEVVKGLREIPKAALKATVTEAGTEAAQEAVEYTGETLGTKTGFAPGQALERALAGAAGGGPFGGAVRTLTGTAQAIANSPGRPTVQGEQLGAPTPLPEYQPGEMGALIAEEKKKLDALKHEAINRGLSFPETATYDDMLALFAERDGVALDQTIGTDPEKVQTALDQYEGEVNATIATAVPGFSDELFPRPQYGQERGQTTGNAEVPTGSEAQGAGAQVAPELNQGPEASGQGPQANVPGFAGQPVQQGGGEPSSLTGLSTRPEDRLGEADVSGVEVPDTTRNIVSSALRGSPTGQALEREFDQGRALKTVWDRGWSMNKDGASNRYVITDDKGSDIAKITPLRRGGYSLNVLGTAVAERFKTLSEAANWVTGTEPAPEQKQDTATGLVTNLSDRFGAGATPNVPGIVKPKFSRRDLMLNYGQQPPVFKSTLASAIFSVNLNKAKVSDWIGLINNLTTKGVTKAEIDASGIIDILRERDAAAVLTKTDVAALAAVLSPKFSERMYGEPYSEEREVELEREMLAIDEETRAMRREHPEDFARWPQELQDHYQALYERQGRLEEEKRHLLGDSDTKYGEWLQPFHASEGYREALIIFDNDDKDGGQFTGGHWNPNNVMVHVRFDVRTDENGKKILFIQEIQSDWHQRGRKHGYQDPAIRKKYTEILKRLKQEIDRSRALQDAMNRASEENDKAWRLPAPRWRDYTDRAEYNALDDARRKAIDDTGRAYEAAMHAYWNHNEQVLRPLEDQLRDLRDSLDYGIPDAPFKDSREWSMLVMKRMLRYAVDNGYDRIGWTRGEHHVERYNQGLRKRVNLIEWEKTKDGVQIKGYKTAQHPVVDENGNFVTDPTGPGEFDQEGIRMRTEKGDPVVSTTEKETALSDAIGKAMADQIFKDPNQTGTISGDNITISDTGMAEFYDRILVNAVNRYIKKYDAKAGRTKVNTATGGLTYKRSGRDITPEEFEAGLASLRSRGFPSMARLMERDILPDMASGMSFERAMNNAGATTFSMNQRTMLAKLFGGQFVNEPDLTEVHAIDITPKLKEAVRGAQPMFSRGEPTPQTTSPADEFERAQRLYRNRQAAYGHGYQDLAMDVMTKPASTLFKGATKDANVRRLQSFIQKVNNEIRRLAPLAHVRVADVLLDIDTGNTVGGLTFRQRDAGKIKQIVAWALTLDENTNAWDVARHEVIHALKQSGLFTPKEWQSLREAAYDGNWLGIYNVRERWKKGDLSEEDLIEEAIAERFADWMGNRDLYVSKDAKPLFQRLAQLVKRLLAVIKETFGRNLSVDEVFDLIDAGWVGRRPEGRWETPYGLSPKRMAGNRPITPRPVPGRPTTGGLGPQAGAGISVTVTQPNPTFLNWPRRKFESIMGETAEKYGDWVHDKMNTYMPKSIDDFIYEGQNLLTPMATGTPRTRAIAKDFANALRKIRYNWTVMDQGLKTAFNRQQRKAMWEAADEESVLRQQGQVPGPNQGLNKLTAEERLAVEQLQRVAENLFQRAQALGMTHAMGLPSYTPRMFVRISRAAGGTLESVSRWGRGETVEKFTSDLGRNVQTSTPQLLHRKHLTTQESTQAAQAKGGADIEIVPDIRTLALAAGRLEQAIAGRELIERIKELGKQVGIAMTAPGTGAHDPKIWFTIDHPSFRQVRPEFIKDPTTGKIVPRKDQLGNIVWKNDQVYVLREFEGPLRAVLSKQSGYFYNALMNLKGRMMAVIMFSPLIHGAVIWGKAVPAAPKALAAGLARGTLRAITFGQIDGGTFLASRSVYVRGGGVIADKAKMDRALATGTDPIGKRYFNQDISSIMEEQEGKHLLPGRSWTANVIAFIPGLLDKGYSDSIKEKIDEWGDVWHNKFLWDQVFKLQMGLWDIIRENEMKKGLDEDSASRLASHFANRYAGSLPIESMSQLARQIANTLLFSRSFTLSNLGAFKDLVNGLPRDLQAQILQNAGKAQLNRVQGVARRKAMGMLAIDIALSMAGLWLGAYTAMFLYGLISGDDDREFVKPGSFGAFGESDNEPGKENRFFIGYQEDGTALYARLPTGKVGEELVEWIAAPRDELLRKLSPFSRFGYGIMANDNGFGQKLYDPTDETPTGWARFMWIIMGQVMDSIVPMPMLEGWYGLATGTSEDATRDVLRSTLPLAGVTISRGAPGGPAVGELYSARSSQEFKIQQAMPGIRQLIKANRMDEARAQMDALGISPPLQNYYVLSTNNPGMRLTPRALREFNQYATPEQRERMDRALERQRQFREANP